MIGGWEIPALVVAALVLFGADKVPKLARGLGQAKKEFMAGQTEGFNAGEESTGTKPDNPPEKKS